MRSVRKWRKPRRGSAPGGDDAGLFHVRQHERPDGAPLVAPSPSRYAMVTRQRSRIARRRAGASTLSVARERNETGLSVASSSTGRSALGTTCVSFATKSCAARSRAGSPRCATQAAPSTAASSSSGVSVAAGMS